MANPEHLKRLEEGVRSWNRWRMISDKTPDLSGEFFKMAKLIGANLSGVNLAEAELMEADLSGANLSWADINWADLSKAELTGTNLLGAKLVGADLKGTSLLEANLTRANLAVARLAGANFFRADLTGATLSDANLEEATLIRTNLTEADLFRANLSGANLNKADLTRANLKGARLREAILIESDFSTADISGADLTGANLHNWTIKGIKCTHITWNNKEIYYENPDDFEKAFTNIESIVEILLSLPFSGLSHLIGRNLEQEINQNYGDGTAIFKGQTAVSDDQTKFEFILHPDQFSELNDKLSKLQSQLNPIIEDFKNKNEPQIAIDFRDEVGWKDLVSLDLVVLKPKEISRKLTERFARLQPLLKSIFNTIQKIFKTGKADG